MTKDIFKDEILNDEQLDQVSGGTYREHRIDKEFFLTLGYRDAAGASYSTIKDMYLANGIRYENDGKFSNTYKILTADGWCAHPQWAVLGYILAQRHYPGFNGKWTDHDYVAGFLRKELCMDTYTF